MTDVGGRLRQAREWKGFSQTEVFRRIKINNKTLSRYEQGGSEPDIDSMRMLAELYEVSIDWLYGRVHDPKQTLSVEAREFSDIIDLSEEEAIQKIKHSFSYKGQDISDEQAKKIYYFSLGVVHKDD